MKLKIYMFALAWLAIAWIAPAQAQVATEWQQLERHDAVQVRLVIPGKTDAAAKLVHGMLQVKLTDPWKTYWRTPGEGGVPPSFAWQDTSVNVIDISWQFPAPERFSVQGIETVGYQGNVSFPWLIHVADWQHETLLKGTLTLATCTDICVISDVPVELPFTPSDLKADMDSVFAYEQARSRIPVQDHPFVAIESMVWSAEQQQLEVRVTHKKAWQQPRIFVDSTDPDLADLEIELLDQNVHDNNLTARFAISHWLEQPNLVSETMQVTLVDQSVQAELAGMVEQGTFAEPVQLWVILGFALIGGLILNIMPCVLPVLGLKLRSIVMMPAQQGLIRRHFIAAALGIIFSFVLLAAMVMALKATGHAIG